MRLRRAVYSLIACVAVVSVTPVLAQDQYVLDPSQFSTVHIPGEMNLLEKFGWAGLLITGHPDTKGIVPVLGYKRNEACREDIPDDVKNLHALLLTESEFDTGPLNELCTPKEDALHSWSDPGWAAEILATGEHTNNLLLLTDELEVAPVGEYWLRCAETRPPAEGSACHDTFSLSPYDFYRRLAAEGSRNIWNGSPS
ncbi:MAG: hypothetical protein OXC53_12465 [Rhodobacteraceae bacterium]|nr:hypothetical protein [Paracoccaceae bacterium]